MDFQVKMCCLCFKTNETFSHINDLGLDNITYSFKISTALPKLQFEDELDYLLCSECCDIIDSTYEFTNRCIKNLKTFKKYKVQMSNTFNSLNNSGCDILVKLSEVENILPDKSDSINLEEIVQESANVFHGNKHEYDNSNNDNKQDEPIFNTKEVLIKVEDSNIINYLNENNMTDDETTLVTAGNSTLKETSAYCSNQQNVSGDISEQLKHEMTDNDKNDMANNEESEMNSSYTDEGATSLKPHKCDICNKRFTRRYDLKRHRLLHTDERPYQCDICEKCFKTNKNLVSHKLTHQGTLKPLTCDVCGLGCVSLCDLKIHRRVHTGEKPFVCIFCGVAFAQKGNLKTHKLIHTGERPFECDKCPRKFISSTGLVRHRPVHTGEKAYACIFCDKLFSSSPALSIHKRRNHLKVNQ